jgi:hypothetical protein
MTMKSAVTRAVQGNDEVRSSSLTCEEKAADNGVGSSTTFSGNAYQGKGSGFGWSRYRAVRELTAYGAGEGIFKS